MACNLKIRITDSNEFFFISYNSEDAERVAPIVQQLDTHNIPMWYDHAIDYGHLWEEVIADHIERSRAVLLFFTKEILYKSESYVSIEYEMAKNYFHKEIFVIFLDEIDSAQIPKKMLRWMIELNRLQNIHYHSYDKQADFISDIISQACGPKTVPSRQPPGIVPPNPPLDPNSSGGPESGPGGGLLGHFPLVLAFVAVIGLACFLFFQTSSSSNSDPTEKVFYTVLYRGENGETLDRLVKEGKSGDQITETVKEIEGYSSSDTQKTILLSDEASNNVIIFEYEKEAAKNSASAVIYTILSVDADSSELLSEKKYYGKEGETLTYRSPSLEGYVAVYEKQTFTLSGEESENEFMVYYESHESIARRLNIPDGKILRYNNHTYYAMKTDSIDTFWEANEYCRDRGAHLAVISDADENSALYDYVFYDLKYDNSYFGLTDDRSEGTWYWADGSQDAYRNWLPGQPDGSKGKEDFALFFYKDAPYKWNDGDFGKDHQGFVTFLMEWEN